MILDRGNGDDPTGPLDLLDTNVGEPDVPNLAAVPLFLDRADTLLEWRRRVGTVQVVERDAVCLQAPKALLDLSLEHLGTPTVPSSFGGDHAAVRDR